MSSILDNLARGHLAGFNGIPEGTLVRELIPDFTPEQPWGEATLGREHRRARFIVADSATGRRLRVWYDLDCRVLLVDFEYPGLIESPEELLKGFGDPDSVLDSSDDLFPHLKERVYASRGLSLISDPDDNFIIRLIAFAPTTARFYIDRLRVNP
jgi:hypothetical protein